MTGLCLNDRNVAITNQKSIAIYRVPRTDEFKDKQNSQNAAIKHMQTFNVTDCMHIFIHDEILIVVGYQNVRTYSFGGIVLKEINFNDNEGKSHFLQSEIIIHISNSGHSFHRESDWSIADASFPDHFHDERIH